MIELRQRSLGLLLRSLLCEAAGASTEGTEDRVGHSPGPVAKCPRRSETDAVRSSPALVDNDAAPNLATLRTQLAALREADAEAANQKAALAALAHLSRLETLTVRAHDLRDSGLGIEVNLRYWREHPNNEVASRFRKLLSHWRDVVVGKRVGPLVRLPERPHRPATEAMAKSNVSAVTAAPSQVTAATSTWNAAWAEVRVARLARDIEAAAWTRCSGCAQDRAYRAKVRFLAAALRRSENLATLDEALGGRVSGDALVLQNEEDLLSEAQRSERQKHREEALQAAVLQESLDLFDASLVCPHCGKSGAKYAVIGDTGSVPIDGTSGHKRQKSKKKILAECQACRERWDHHDGWHI